MCIKEFPPAGPKHVSELNSKGVSVCVAVCLIVLPRDGQVTRPGWTPPSLKQESGRFQGWMDGILGHNFYSFLMF